MHLPNISDIRECSCRAFPDRVTNEPSLSSFATIKPSMQRIARIARKNDAQ